MKKGKKVLLILLAAALFLLLAGGVAMGAVLRAVQTISVSTPDLRSIPNGDYMGEYSIAPVSVKVKVSICNCQISDIAILQHENGLGSKAERIVSDIVREQSLDVDVVSGATVSSKCILKAVESAIGEQNR